LEKSPAFNHLLLKTKDCQLPKAESHESLGTIGILKIGGDTPDLTRGYEGFALLY